MDNISKNLPYGIRIKLLASFFIIILSLAGLNTYTLVRITALDRILSGRVDKQIELHNIHNELQLMNSHISNYIRSGNEDYILGYDKSYSSLISNLNVISIVANENREMKYSLRDLRAMIETYRDKSNHLIDLYDEGGETIYVIGEESEFLKLSGYIRVELEQLNSLFLDDLQSFFVSFKEQMDRNFKISIAAIILIILFCYILAWNFSLSVSRPIHQLALALISFGKDTQLINLDVPKRKDEITILFRTFNEMSVRIIDQIEGIQEKAELEQQLKDRALLHHQTEHLLKESELALLQSQINPHFLFNTLNIIDSLSNIEDAPRTGKMIRSLSDLLRYNLIMQKRDVPLEEEIQLINSYIHIQKTRFGEKLSYEENLETSLLSHSVPALILQPLVENAIKHGLEPISRMGRITLTVKYTERGILVEIQDNGCGISQDRIDEIMNLDIEMDSMGIRNVIRRLKLKYDQPCLTILRGEDGGTICRILIPS